MKSKQCVHCREVKSVEEFAYSNRLLGTRQKHCRACMSKFNKESYERNKKKRRKSIYEKRQERREEARRYVWDYLSTHPCVDCGETDPRLLEFDHVRGKKVDSVSQLANGRYSLETLQKEIAKCVVRCANCHRKKTYTERGWFRG